MTASIDRYRASTTEAEMERGIRDAVPDGYVFHVDDSRKVPGMEHFPDLVVVSPRHRLVAFLELKSQKRKITPGQQSVIATLQSCDIVRAGIVRPVPHPGEIGYDEIVAMLGGS
jgi:hypothetical protein